MVSFERNPLFLCLLICEIILFRSEGKKKIKLEPELINYRTFDPEKKRYACAYCGLKFPMRADRASHEKEIHIDETGKFLEISCDLCQEKLPSPVHFRRHAQGNIDSVHTPTTC